MSESTSEIHDATGAKGLLGTIERVGNKVPHPVLMFGYLILLVIALSWVLNLAGWSVAEQVAVPADTSVEYDYYEDTTAPGVITRSRTTPTTG